MLKIATLVLFLLLIAAPLLVRFRPRWVAAFNLKVTNRLTAPFATWLPGFGVISHVGRKSARLFRTPVNVFRAPEGFFIALTYGPNSQWVQNVLAAGGGELETGRTKYRLSAPTLVHDPTRRRFPPPVRVALLIIGASHFLQVSSSRIA
ncbi:MAG TPA: nitroreductase family deazaflavin-dependent oxidoreductase [Candidatus Sulfotelmatobacter sp.]|nr:nitroreductase family deazaflavin-dependent oxidoreductase [Candidatus Sulfotelmatobacter sp.]